MKEQIIKNLDKYQNITLTSHVLNLIKKEINFVLNNENNNQIEDVIEFNHENIGKFRINVKTFECYISPKNQLDIVEIKLNLN